MLVFHHVAIMRMVRINEKNKLLHGTLYSQTVGPYCDVARMVRIDKKYYIVHALHSHTYDPTVMLPINIRTKWLTHFTARYITFIEAGI